VTLARGGGEAVQPLDLLQAVLDTVGCRVLLDARVTCACCSLVAIGG
jgi:hypothetical protein